MSGLAFSRDLLVLDSELERPRWAVEREKLNRNYPGFKFYGSGGVVSSVQGWLRTSAGVDYYVKIEIPAGGAYPYQMPKVYLPYASIDPSCPHRYGGGDICLMRSSQWTSTISIAAIVAKAAVWINKYDVWLGSGKRKWPGNEQQH